MITVILSLFDTGLYVLRSLARLGLKVCAIDYNKKNPGFYSKYAREAVINSIDDSDEGLLHCLDEIAKNEEQVLVLPANDKYLEQINRLRGCLQKKICLLVPEQMTVSAILNKKEQFNLVKAHCPEISIPRYIEIHSADISEYIDSLVFPLFIKPQEIQKWKTIFKNKGVVLNSLDELTMWLKKIEAAEQKILIQEIIPGPETHNFESSFYFDQSGRCRQSFTIQKIRQWPMQFGSATMTMTVNNLIVENMARNLLYQLSWRGFANVEFKYDARNQCYQFIEINARVWQQIGHAERLGVNFPLLAYLDALGQPLPNEKKYKINSKWIDLPSDFLAAYKSVRNSQSHFLSVASSFKGIDSYGLASLDDLRPFFYSLGLI